MNIKNADKIISGIYNTVKQWKKYADRVKVKKDKRDQIAKTHIEL